MKRTPLSRRTPLKSGGSLKRTRLKPRSEKAIARAELAAAHVLADGLTFKLAIRKERCVVCGRDDATAREQTGYGLQAHHGIAQTRLKAAGLSELLWAPENAVAVCEEPCHRRHTSRHTRIRRASLPARVVAFARWHGLERELQREYPD